MNEHRAVHPDDAYTPITDVLGQAASSNYALRPRSLDIEEPAGTIKIRIPDPISCLPKTARRVGGRHHKRPNVTELTDLPSAAIPDWGVGEVRSVVSAPAVTFHSKASTFDFFSTKTRRVVYGIGPHEFAHAKDLETNPFVVDFALQAIRATWNVDGRDHYTSDAIALMADATVVSTEVKASASYFEDPKYAPVMWNAARSFEAVGITFSKVTGDEMDANRRRSWNVSRVFHDRGTDFDERDAYAVANLLAAEGGRVPLGRVTERLSANSSVGRQMANAMMCARHLAYDLNAAVTPDTEVTAAPRATALFDIRRIGL